MALQSSCPPLPRKPGAPADLEQRSCAVYRLVQTPIFFLTHFMLTVLKAVQLDNRYSLVHESRCGRYTFLYFTASIFSLSIVSVFIRFCYFSGKSPTLLVISLPTQHVAGNLTENPKRREKKTPAVDSTTGFNFRLLARVSAFRLAYI